MSQEIHIIKGETSEGQTLKILKQLHTSPIRFIKFNSTSHLVVSADDNGIIEIWDPETFGKIIFFN